jgi:hypothetical protein
MASKQQSGRRNIVQKPFHSQELEHGEQVTIRPKEYRAKAVPLAGARTWQASDNQAEGISCKSRSTRRSSNMASKRQSGQRNIVQKPFRSKELEHGKQTTIRPKEYKSILTMKR